MSGLATQQHPSGAVQKPAGAQERGARSVMATVRSLDSQMFGFLSFHKNSSSGSDLAATAVGFVSKELIQEGIMELRHELKNASPHSIPHKSGVFCQLGHLHLLLEEYNEALSAYKQCQALSSDCQSNASYLYGLGLIYFHLRAHEWAIDAFQRVLKVNPAFSRASEVHLRLGVLYKREAEFARSREHFERALSSDPGEASSFSKLEIHFHLAHLLHLQDSCLEARDKFEAILSSEGLPTAVKALTLRQLGWLYHTAPELSPSSSSSSSSSSSQDGTAKAIELLSLAVGADPTCGQTWYFLGRCQSAQGHAHKAFMSYQQAVEKCSSGEQSDIWCSIGLLYHSMGQPRDSLQSYLCAVYLDSAHLSAWSNTGCLYEAVAQPMEALICYKNAVSARNKKPTRNKSTEPPPVSADYVLSRIACLESYVSSMSALLQSEPRPLPPLEEAWHTLVPPHIRAKHSPPDTPILTLSDLQLSSIPPSTNLGPLPLPSPLTAPPPSKRQRLHKSKDPIVVSSLSDVWSQGIPPGISPGDSPNFAFPPGVFPTPINSVPVLATGMGSRNESLSGTGIELGLNGGSNMNALSPAPSDQSSSGCGFVGVASPMQQLAALRNQALIASSSSLRQPDPHCSPQAGDGVVSPSGSSGRSKRRRSRPHHHNPHTLIPSPLHPHTVTGAPHNSHYPNLSLDFHSNNLKMIPFLNDALPSDLAKVTPLAISSRQVEERLSDYLMNDQEQGSSLLGSHDTSRLDDIGSRVSNLPDSPKKRSRNTVRGSKSSSNKRSSATSNDERLSEDAATALADRVSDSSSGVSSAGTSNPSPLSPSPPTAGNRLPSSSSISPKSSPPLSTTAGTVSTTNSDNLRDKHFSFLSRRPSSETSTSVSTTVGLEGGLLTPIDEPFPSLADEAEYMLQDPDLRPRKAPKAPKNGKIDLKPEVPVYQVLSRSEAMSQELHAFCCDPERHICMMRGMCSVLGMNLDLYSSHALTETCPGHEIEVREQRLQAADENWDASGRRLVWRCESSKSLTTVGEYSAYQQRVLLGQEELSLSDPSPPVSAPLQLGARPRMRKMLRFGTNVDLSSEDKWGAQISELAKLPKFLRVSCPEANFLTHIGHTILGMNSVQLYMKVTGSRTPGHQENNNFCSVNINIGPGTCEWFAVPNQYWGVIHELCEKHKLSFLVGSWWPVLEELSSLKIPVYRFTQLVGDIVWINPGTVHWVQANGVCNNIAWNIGPLTAHQFRMSWERYQWNKVQKVRSIVPMIHLSWNVARSLKLRDHTLYAHLRSLLESSLSQTQGLLSNLERAGIPVVWHGREEGDHAPCCSHCLEELFNVLFVLSHKGQNSVYCHKCAGSLKKSFTVLQQYKIEELEDILSSFKLHPS